MSPKLNDRLLYCDTLAAVAERGRWATIDDYYRACSDAGVWDDGFRASALEAAAKAKIRRDLKGGKVTTADGRTVRVANIVVKDLKGVAHRVYKDESLLDVGDCVQVVRYWRDRRKYCAKRVRYYTKLAVKLHGAQIQGLLPLRD